MDLMAGERMARAMYRAARGVAHAGIGSRPAMGVARLLGVRNATVFMLHRFHDGSGSNDPSAGTDVRLLRGALSAFRRQGVAMMTLRDLIAHIEAKKPLTRPTAVFTVDDGYRDFLDLAAPIFAGFDVEPTAFLISEFVSGRQWCWWDRVVEAFVRSPRRDISIACDSRIFHYSLGTPAQRRHAGYGFVEDLKWVSDAERRRVAESIGTYADVELPVLPPAEYQSLTWSEVRELERAGVHFGPHSRTHPILSRVDDAAARREIHESWTDLQREVHDPVPVFCYPNGTLDSFGQREMQLVRDAGMRSAVAFRRRYVNPRTCSADDLFALSRYPMPSDLTDAVYIASGLAWE